MSNHKAYGLVKAERMYGSITTFEQLAVVDRYTRLAGRLYGYYGCSSVDLLKGARKQCVERLNKQSEKPQ